MKNNFLRLLSVLLVFGFADLRAADISTEVYDPLYIPKLSDFVMKTSIDFGRYTQIREDMSYGFSDKFSLLGDIYWRAGDGYNSEKVSKIGLLSSYRAGNGDTGATDILVGYGFGGFGVVPSYSDEAYNLGLRTGKQWAGMTLAATALTNWIFDDSNGMAYIDFIPEIYLRMQSDFSFGFSLDLRKATLSKFNQQWVSFKLGRMIGKTGWFFNTGYEFQSRDVRIGGSMSMLF